MNGSSSDGRLPLVLVPGLLCDAALWDHQNRYLDEVAAVHVADATRHDTIEAMARSVLDEAPDNFALAGLSMGGYVAMEIMRQAPDRVLRLALLDTTARPDREDQRRRRRGMVALAKTGKFKGVTPRLIPMLIHPDRQAEPELCDAILGMAERVGKDAFIRQQTAIMGRPDSRPDLGRVRCPTLVVCGREDAVTPLELSVEIADAIPGARLSVIEECGHLSTMERPQAATALLRDWLLYR